MSITFSTEHIIASQKTAFDTLASFARSSLNHIEKLNALNLATTRNLFTGHIEGVGSLLTSKTPQDIIALQNSLLQPQIEKVATYAHQLHDIAREAHDELVVILEGQHAELNDTVSSILDGFAKTSGNSGAALAAVKSAISAANSAFANANKAARQVAGITGAGVSATVQAIGAANQNQAPARKKIAA